MKLDTKPHCGDTHPTGLTQVREDQAGYGNGNDFDPDSDFDVDKNSPIYGSESNSSPAGARVER